MLLFLLVQPLRQVSMHIKPRRRSLHVSHPITHGSRRTKRPHSRYDDLPRPAESAESETQRYARPRQHGVVHARQTGGGAEYRGDGATGHDGGGSDGHPGEGDSGNHYGGPDGDVDYGESGENRGYHGGSEGVDAQAHRG